MKTRAKVIISICMCVIVLLFGIGIGSIYVPPLDIINILLNKLFSNPLPSYIPSTSTSILWNLRFPRTILAFIVGGALAVSGTVMQSVLKNPLASSYTLGVSSGASVGAGIVIITGFNIPLIGIFTLPLVGLIFGLSTVFLAVSFTSRLDKNMENNTIILVGMVFSLFINAVLTLMTAMSKQHLEQIALWQMGSFALKEWANVLVLFPIVLFGILLLMRYSKELDIMTFGEDQARAIGVDIHKIKWILLGISAALTGSAISFVGVIGFIDLIAPHVVRKIFGSSHKIVIPMSVLFGGSFMVIADLVARTIISPSELPVGSITALIGAPFFIYVYFSRRKAV